MCTMTDAIEECDSCLRPKDQGEHLVRLRPEQFVRCTLCSSAMVTVCSAPATRTTSQPAPAELTYRCGNGHAHFGPLS